jgi:hypothetical protein
MTIPVDPEYGTMTQTQRAGLPLLPYERWYAKSMLARQQSHQTRAVLRMRQNYGPEGLVLRAANTINRLLTSMFWLVAIVLMIASGGRGALDLTGYLLLALAFCLAALGFARAQQAKTAGRAFRGGLPFLTARAATLDSKDVETAPASAARSQDSLDRRYR